MFSHMTVGSNDIARSQAFYDALFAAMGGRPAMQDDKGRLIYMHNGAMFLVGKPIDGEDATHANGGTIGFTLASPEQIDAWHAAGTQAGGGRSRIRRASAPAAWATCTSPICATLTATSSAPST